MPYPYNLLPLLIHQPYFTLNLLRIAQGLCVLLSFHTTICFLSLKSEKNACYLKQTQAKGRRTSPCLTSFCPLVIQQCRALKNTALLIISMKTPQCFSEVLLNNKSARSANKLTETQYGAQQTRALLLPWQQIQA